MGIHRYIRRERGAVKSERLAITARRRVSA